MSSASSSAALQIRKEGIKWYFVYYVLNIYETEKYKERPKPEDDENFKVISKSDPSVTYECGNIYWDQDGNLRYGSRIQIFKYIISERNQLSTLII